MIWSASLPWGQLIDCAIEEWADRAVEAMRYRRRPREVCECWSLQRRIPGGDHLEHWAVHDLHSRIRHIRANVEANALASLLSAAPEPGEASAARREARTRGLPQKRQVALNATLARFDEAVNERMPRIPARARELRERYRALAREISPGSDAEVARAALGEVLDAELADHIEAKWSGAAVGRAVTNPVSGGRAVAEVYELLGLEPPRHVLWARSPREGANLVGAVITLVTAHLADSHSIVGVDVGLAASALRAHLSEETVDAALRVAASLVGESAGSLATLLPVRGRFSSLIARLDDRRDRLEVVSSFDRLDLELSIRYPMARGKQLEAIASTLRREQGTHLAYWSPTDVWDHSTTIEQFDQLGLGNRYGLGGILSLRRAAYCWWGFRGFAVLCEQPDTVGFDDRGELHSETGAALEWSDGWALHAWHGTLVPRDLIEGRWDAGRIFGERNVEVRRCAIEKIGWPRFVREARLVQVGAPHPDPANPGFQLTLFEVPSRTYLAGPARVLLCTNASLERDSSRRSFGLLVPDSVPDALAAAAWTFGLDRDEYAQLEAAS